ncbi:hypothetical protein PJP09_29175, partial [Mycobacterium kansasii]
PRFTAPPTTALSTRTDTLPLPDALPIWGQSGCSRRGGGGAVRGGAGAQRGVREFALLDTGRIIQGGKEAAG